MSKGEMASKGASSTAVRLTGHVWERAVVHLAVSTGREELLMRVLNASPVAGNMEPLMVYEHRKGLVELRMGRI